MAGQNSTADRSELEQLRGRIELFRTTHPKRSRLPRALWGAATELAKCHGIFKTAKELGLNYTGLKRRVESHGSNPDQSLASSPAFLELLTPFTGTVASCLVEVESPNGAKLRLELKTITTTELAALIQTFAGH